MRKSTKSIAIVLVLAMVVCAFCATLSASAENENILAGMSYEKATDSTADGGFPDGDLSGSDGTLMTDGAYRGDGTHDWNGDLAVAGVSSEYMGTGKSVVYTFTFDSAKNISTIIIRGTRESFDSVLTCNRNTTVQSVQVTTDGDSYNPAAIEAKYIACAGAPELESNDKSATAPQFYDIYVSVVGATGVTGMKIALTNDVCYVMQLDEIEAYAETVNPPVVEESSAAAETSDAAAETSEAAAETSVAAPETSEEPAKVADVTFKVSAVENADGTVTVTVSTPDNEKAVEVLSGKVVISVSDKLTFKKGEVAAGVTGFTNDKYVAKDAAGNAVNGVCLSFANATALAKGTVVATFTYEKAEGAELSAADITVPEWNISDVNGQKIAQTGWVTKRGEETYVDGGLADVTFTNEAAAESSADASTATSEASGATSEASGATSEASGATSEASGATSEASGATSETSGATSEASGATSEASGATSEASGATSETSGATSETSNASADETSQGGGSGSDKTGDAGVIAFAVLAVISGAAVVVLKKRA